MGYKKIEMKRAPTYNRDVALDAAMSLFWKKGFHATSLKDLEGALTMKPGSIYAAFSSKENLFLLTLERYFDHNRAEFVKYMNDAATPLTGLADFLRMIGDAELTEKPQACMLVKSLLNTTDEDATIREKVSGYLELMEAEMANVFARAIEQGELPSDLDPQQLARRYQSSVTALKIEAQRQVNPEVLAASAEELAQTIEVLSKTGARGIS